MSNVIPAGLRACSKLIVARSRLDPIAPAPLAGPSNYDVELRDVSGVSPFGIAHTRQEGDLPVLRARLVWRALFSGQTFDLYPADARPWRRAGSKFAARQLSDAESVESLARRMCVVRNRVWREWV